MTRSSNDHIFQSFGDLDFPVEGTDVTDSQLFSAFDPARDNMLDLFEAAILQELGHSTSSVATTSPWYAARSGTSLATFKPVETKLKEPPRRTLFRGARYDFPMLCLYRQRSEHNELTLGHDQIITFWGLDYILGPLTSHDYSKLGGALHGVRSVLRLVMRRGFHPAYDSGAKQFGNGKGKLSYVQAIEDTEGPAVFGWEGPSGRDIPNDDIELFTLHMVLRTSEIEDALPPEEFVEGAPYEGFDLNVGIDGTDGKLPDVIQANSTIKQQPPLGKPVG